MTNPSPFQLNLAPNLNCYKANSQWQTFPPSLTRQMYRRHLATKRTMSKHTFARLPLPASTEITQHNLPRIDPSLPSGENPHTAQRRSQTFPKAGVWARVTPLPIAFPYRLPRAAEGEKQQGIEDWLAGWDAFEPASEGMEARVSEKRKALQPELIGYSERCVSDVLEHLDVGNAGRYTGQEGDGEDRLDEAAQEFVDCVAGKRVVTGQAEGKEYGPWSSRYAGMSCDGGVDVTNRYLRTSIRRLGRSTRGRTRDEHL